MTLGVHLSKLRSRASLSQDEIARRCTALGVPGVLQHTISRWERGTHQPSLAQFAALLEATGATEELAALAVAVGATDHEVLAALCAAPVEPA